MLRRLTFLLCDEEATPYYFDMMETVFTTGLGFAPWAELFGK